MFIDHHNRYSVDTQYSVSIYFLIDYVEMLLFNVIKAVWHVYLQTPCEQWFNIGLRGVLSAWPHLGNESEWAGFCYPSTLVPLLPRTWPPIDLIHIFNSTMLSFACNRTSENTMVERREDKQVFWPQESHVAIILATINIDGQQLPSPQVAKQGAFHHYVFDATGTRISDLFDSLQNTYCKPHGAPRLRFIHLVRNGQPYFGYDRGPRCSHWQRKS